MRLRLDGVGLWSKFARLAAATMLLWLTGCGVGSASSATKSGGQSGPAILIMAQPVSQIVPIGRPATFTVNADGAGVLRYQWTRNGTAISGATSSSYTVPDVSSSDTGESFQVTISNTVGNATSQAAILTAGPRAPKIGDLRYLLWQQVTLPGLGNYGGEPGTVAAGYEEIPDAVGSTLELGSGLCGQYAPCTWAFSAVALPPPMTGLTMWYRAGNLPNLNADLRSIVASNVVITSLALEPKYKQYGMSWVQATHFSGFEYNLQIVSPAEIQATAAADGAEGRVATAVSFDGPNEVYLISYGWQGSPTTYDVKTMTAAAQNVYGAAQELAAEGYIISAFGGDDTSGWVLIGIHASGYSQPRSLAEANLSKPSIPTIPPDTAYFTPVIGLQDYGMGTGAIDISEQ